MLSQHQSKARRWVMDVPCWGRPFGDRNADGEAGQQRKHENTYETCSGHYCFLSDDQRVSEGQEDWPVSELYWFHRKKPSGFPPSMHPAPMGFCADSPIQNYEFVRDCCPTTKECYDAHEPAVPVAC